MNWTIKKKSKHFYCCIAPTELLFNRIIVVKIPSIFVISKNLLDEETRDIDAPIKKKDRRI